MKPVFWGLAALGLFLGVPGPADADYIFTTLDPPGSTATEAYGINASGQVYQSDITALCLRRRAHCYEEGPARGAERGGASESATGVTTRRREGHLPASPFSRHTPGFRPE
jgi:hypothetical protein